MATALKRPLDGGHQSPFSSPKRMRCNPYQIPGRAASNSPPSQDFIAPAINAGKLAADIEAARKRLKRMDSPQLDPSNPATRLLGQVLRTTPPFAHAIASSSSTSPPLFTMEQVAWLCSRVLSEREEELRREYDSTLQARLLEQREQFLTFTQEQLHSRMSEHTSYLS